ncbi:MAG: hypothetical protein CMN76_13035 [Spirochaetaceae bacterium]|nr:hypothetical protein [Spirochaetaceae bacterium]|tara:strand:- start:15255 stop:15860 length:606 start_codon:yes stop_codon:yes gene_type:complete
MIVNRRNCSRGLFAAGFFTFLLSLQPIQANEPETVVLFLNGNQISAGFAGESSPRFSMPAAVATSGGSGPIGMQRPKTLYGQQAVDSGGSNLTYAVQAGRIVDFNAFKKLVSHMLNQKLGVDPTEIALVMNESSASTDSEREQTTRMMFESFGLPYFFMSPHFQSFSQISEMASRSTFREALITKDEYDEKGAGIIHQKSN